MIKVSFFTKSGDVCEQLENELKNNSEIEDWLEQNLPSLNFDCMDYPFDTENCYGCYFNSPFEEADALEICRLLKNIKLGFSVEIVDDKLNFVRKIKEKNNADRL